MKCSCRFCGKELKYEFVNLGMLPLANSYVLKDKAEEPEVFFPLHPLVCDNCFLVQLPVLKKPESIFSYYDYFSSYSRDWLFHSEQYVEMIQKRLNLGKESLVIEVASNDGYLLQYFVKKGIPWLGIEPAANVAEVAKEKGIETIIAFFGKEEAENITNKRGKADLLIANNVFAHVPDINSFVEGIKLTLKDTGIVTIEFPNLSNLIKYHQFDTIYHEHFSYLSFTTAKKILEAHGLKVFDVEELATHGGSVRIYACLSKNKELEVSEAVPLLLQKEESLTSIETYIGFSREVQLTKKNILKELIKLKEKDVHIIAYGAAAKGNTLLNYCGISTDFVDYAVDINPNKQDKLLPGTHIPIFGEKKIRETRPDYIIILPWNIKEEIMKQLEYVQEWGAQFIVLIPEIEYFDRAI